MTNDVLMRFIMKQKISPLSFLFNFEIYIFGASCCSGAGKTTTLSIVTGMIEATSGDVLIRGKSVKRDMLEIRQDLGLCPQYDILWPQLTVYEHLRY